MPPLGTPVNRSKGGAGAPSRRIPRPGRFTYAPRLAARPSYDTPKHRLESSHSAVEAAAVEARRRVRLKEGGSLEDEYRGRADKEDTNKALILRPSNLR
jgi:hypothetical protein